MRAPLDGFQRYRHHLGSRPGRAARRRGGHGAAQEQRHPAAQPERRRVHRGHRHRRQLRSADDRRRQRHGRPAPAPTRRCTASSSGRAEDAATQSATTTAATEAPAVALAQSVQRGDRLRQRQLRARGGRHHHAQPAEQPGRADLRRRGGQPEHDRGAQRQLGDPHAVAQPSGRGVRGLLRRPGRAARRSPRCCSATSTRRATCRSRSRPRCPRCPAQYRRAVAGHERPGAVLRGPGHRVPLVRREQRHPAVPVRVRPVLHHVLVQQPARRGDVRQRRPRSPRR